MYDYESGCDIEGFYLKLVKRGRDIEGFYLKLVKRGRDIEGFYLKLVKSDRDSLLNLKIINLDIFKFGYTI